MFKTELQDTSILGVSVPGWKVFDTEGGVKTGWIGIDNRRGESAPDPRANVYRPAIHCRAIEALVAGLMKLKGRCDPGETWFVADLQALNCSHAIN